MSMKVSRRSAAIITESLPLMEARRDELEVAIRRVMERESECDIWRDGNRTVTVAIMNMLFDYARQIKPSGVVLPIETHARRHRDLAVRSGHYSAFGGGLNAVIKDVLRADATPSLLAAWTDAYWAIVKANASAELRLAA